MAIRTALRVRVPDHHGALVQVLEALARAHLQVEAVVALAAGSETIIQLLPKGPHHALHVLQQAGLEVEAVAVAVAWVPYGPGGLAGAAETLVAAGLTIDSLYAYSVDPALGQQVAIQCADARRADQLLWALIY
jgi:hypothetical protein